MPGPSAGRLWFLKEAFICEKLSLCGDSEVLDLEREIRSRYKLEQEDSVSMGHCSEIRGPRHRLHIEIHPRP